jgi:alkylhydroperoxidase family enzyme
VLADLDTAPIGEPLRAMLGFMRKLTKDHHAVTADDITGLLDRGVTRAQIDDALAVCFAFNVIDRLADAFCFEVGDDKFFQIGASMLIKRGYK